MQTYATPMLPHSQELELLDEDAKVYKQIGPALIRQDHIEATSNVSKRLEFIGAEIKRIDEKLDASQGAGPQGKLYTERFNL